MAVNEQCGLIYNKLSPDQQKELEHMVIQKLHNLVGGHRDFPVLAEYVVVMLQSRRTREVIQIELDVFLQEHTVTFTDWLCNAIEDFSKTSMDAPGEGLGPIDRGNQIIPAATQRDSRYMYNIITWTAAQLQQSQVLQMLHNLSSEQRTQVHQAV